MKLFRSLSLVLMACLVALACIGCGVFHKSAPAPSAQAQAPQTPLHKIIAACYQVANGLNSGEKEFESLYTSGIPGVSDDGYAKTVGQTFQKAIAGNDQFIAQLKTLKQIDPSNKAQVVAWIGSWTSSIGTLLNQGVLGIKNPDARANILSALSLVPSGVQIVQDAIALIPDAQPSPAASPAPGHAQIQAARKQEVALERKDSCRNYRCRSGDHRQPAGVHYQPQESVRAERRSVAFRGGRSGRTGSAESAGVPRVAVVRKLSFSSLRV